MVASDGTVKVLDFGLGRAVTSGRNDDFDPFELGGMTPAYASPEMLANQPPEPADDVFALGIVAFELLTGRHPFNRRSANLSCKLTCLQTNFAYLAKNRTLTAANDKAVEVLKGKRPDCGRCPDYRKTYGLRN